MSYAPIGSIWSTSSADYDDNGGQTNNAVYRQHDSGEYSQSSNRRQDSSAAACAASSSLSFSYSAHSQQYQRRLSPTHLSPPASYAPPISPGRPYSHEQYYGYSDKPSSPMESTAHSVPSYQPASSPRSPAPPSPRLTYTPQPSTAPAAAQPVEKKTETNSANALNYQKRLQSIAARRKKSSKLPPVTPEIISQLASCLADKTVFEIFRELQEIQHITERKLLSDRMRTLNQHKTKRIQLARQEKESLQENAAMSHRLPQIKASFREKKQAMEKGLEEEMRLLDQRIILQLDQQVSEQQVTLQQVGVPCLYASSNPDEQRLQMAILELVMALIDQLKAHEQ